MVFHVRVGYVYGICSEERDGVDLKEGGHFGDFKVSVESVPQKGIAGVRV